VFARLANGNVAPKRVIEGQATNLSRTMHGIAYDAQFMRTMIVVGVIFFLAQFALGYAIVKFRNDGRPAGYSHGNNKLEAIWTSATALLFLALVLMGTKIWAGVHFVVRALPPGGLRGFQPEHLLVGHGRGVHGPAAAAALEQAYARSRRDLPRLAIRMPKLALGALKRR